jgi:hypothetical protein
MFPTLTACGVGHALLGNARRAATSAKKECSKHFAARPLSGFEQRALWFATATEQRLRETFLRVRCLL